MGALTHPKMAGVLAARLYGDTPDLRTRVSDLPFITKDGRIFFTEQLLEAMRMYRLNTSFVKSGNAQHMLRDLQKNENGWAQIVGRSPARAQALLIESATAIDNYFRAGVFLDEMYNGKSMAEAAKTATDAMYDYSKLTDFEKQVLRRAFMFYSYTRNNLNLFYDTLVTNPHRIMGQIRLMRGLREQNTEGSNVLIEDDYTSQRLSVFFRQAYANQQIYQGVRFLAAPLPIMDAINLHREVGAFINAGFNLSASDEAREAGLKFLARLNPLLQQPLVFAFDEEIFRSRSLAGDVVPTSIVELDINMTGGTFVMGFLDCVPVPITKTLKKEYPTQEFVWVARNKQNYWLWKNALQIPFPVLDLGVDDPGLLDYTVPGILFNAARQLPKAIKEGRLGVLPGGRSIDSFVQFDRANVGYVETVMYLANKQRQYRQHHGYIEDDLFDPETTRDKPLVDRLADPERFGYGIEPRVELGPMGELMSVFFRAKLVPTVAQREQELREQMLREERKRAEEIEGPYER